MGVYYIILSHKVAPLPPPKKKKSYNIDDTFLSLQGQFRRKKTLVCSSNSQIPNDATSNVLILASGQRERENAPQEVPRLKHLRHGAFKTICGKCEEYPPLIEQTTTKYSNS